MYCACVQASGVAESVGVPGSKPGVPAGGCWSQTCSGSMSPGPAAWPSSRSCAAAAPARSPAAISYSPRSPLSSGQPRPIVVRESGGWPKSHGAPSRNSP